MANVAPPTPTRRPDEEPDVDEAPHPWLDDPNSPAYAGLCQQCGHAHPTAECPHVPFVVWGPRSRLHRTGTRAHNAALRRTHEPAGGAS